jgi:hypothetical protein
MGRRILLAGFFLIASSLHGAIVDVPVENYFPPGATAVAFGECTLWVYDWPDLLPAGDCRLAAYADFTMAPGGGAVTVMAFFYGPDDPSRVWLVSGFMDVIVQYSTEIVILGGTGNGVVDTSFWTYYGHSGIVSTSSIEFGLQTTFGAPEDVFPTPSHAYFPFTFGEPFRYDVLAYLRVTAIEPERPFRFSVYWNSMLHSILDASGEVVEGAFIAECPCDVAVPEPQAWLMLSAGLPALAGLRRRSRALRRN